MDRSHDAWNWVAGSCVLVGAALLGISATLVSQKPPTSHVHWTTTREAFVGYFLFVVGTVCYAVGSRRAAPRTGVRREELERLLAAPLERDGSLPTVRTVRMYDVRVSLSKYAVGDNLPPYVPRHVDGKLEQAVTSGGFILVVGASKSGKSRSAFEVLRRTRPDARLIVPAEGRPTPGRLANLKDVVDWDGSVLWLDDLDRYLGPNGLDLKVLDKFFRCDPPVTIVATLSSKRRQRLLKAEGEVGRGARIVLSRGRLVMVPRLLTGSEQTAARSLYPHEDFDFAARGIGEQLVAAPLLEQKYDDGFDSDPEGWCVVQAAIDCRRVGHEAAVPEQLLRELFGLYLFAYRLDLEATEDAWQAGLGWAKSPVAGNVALLLPGRIDNSLGYRAFGHIFEYVDRQVERPAIPRFMWDFAIDNATRQGLVDVGIEALTRQERAIAKQAFRRAETTEEDEHADEAQAWAAVLLGETEFEDGNLEAAMRHFEAAIESHIADVADIAKMNLGAALIFTGDLKRARSLLEAALGSGDAEVVPMAQVNLGALALREGDLDRAHSLLEAALGAGDAQVVPMAQANLGALALREGDLERARSLLETALKSGHSRAVSMARVNLGALALREGDLDRARSLLEAALGSGDAQVVPMAQANLGALALRDGNVELGRSLLETALKSGHSRAVSMARVNLGALALRDGNVELGRSLLEAALGAGDAQVVPMAQANLGALALREGDLDRARSLLEDTLASDNCLVLRAARTTLGLVLMLKGEGETALPLLEAEARSGDHDQGPRAAYLLGELLRAQAESKRAKDAYTLAIDSGHFLWAPRARIDMASLLVTEGQLSEAQALLEPLVDISDTADLAADAKQAWNSLAMAFDTQRRYAEAVTAYTHVIRLCAAAPSRYTTGTARRSSSR